MIRESVLSMHHTERGRTLLPAGRLSRFVALEDADYDPHSNSGREARTQG